ncbi:MAG: hypothetical protein KF768_10410 [Phycisphaeraceae bacterium]|nr:hypothetical protein [Phycisphaeraceae bacterium]
MSQMSTGGISPQDVTGSAGVDIAMAAAARERANTSRVLIILSLVVFLGACIYAFTGIAARREAASKVARQVNATQATRQLAERFRAATEGQADARFAADPLMGSKIERLADSVGLKLSGPVAFVELPTVGGVAGMVQRRFTARAANADPAILIEFLIGSQDRAGFPGLDITNIVLRPSGRAAGAEATHDGGWDLQVDFTRWERRAG